MHDIIILAQREIVSALSVNTVISAAITGIYDQTPEQSALPYISIENVAAEELPTIGRASYRTRAILHYHESYGGKQDSLDFVGAIVSALKAVISSDVAYHIIVSDVQIAVQNINTKQNTRSTELAIELYIDRLGE